MHNNIRLDLSPTPLDFGRMRYRIAHTRFVASWRDLPGADGSRTTCYNRFVRWRLAGVWDQIMDALAASHNAAVQMI
jgi:transposase